MKSKHQNINSQQKECLTFNEKMHFIIIIIITIIIPTDHYFSFFFPDPEISCLTRYKIGDLPHSDLRTFMNCDQITLN